MLAPQRLRPQWTEQWIANPMRFLTYPNMMPQNFPADKPVGYNFFHGTPRQHAEAARDALMDLPRLADMPVNRYRLAPKGGK
jgi:hypothetical protein